MTVRNTIPLVLAACATLIGCDNEAKKTAVAMVGGDPDRGQAEISSYGCSSCHTIPGVHGANALVGPPLTHMGARTYVAGMLQNTPDNLEEWIKDPPHINPKTAMPNLHVTSSDARDITTYLYSLQ